MTSTPARIAFIITELDEGGAERALTQIVTRLDRSRWEPQVFSLAGQGPLTQHFESAGIPVCDCGARTASNPFHAWRVVSKLTAALLPWRPQIVQTFLFHANVLGRLAAWRAGVPHVLSGIRVADRRGRLRLRLDRWTERFVERHVCVSHAVADFSTRESGLDPAKIVVIPNGVDLAAFQNAESVDLTEFGVPTGSQVVLSVGRLDPQKDPLKLLTAFELVTRQIPDAHLVLVGDGPLKAEIQRRISRASVSGSPPADHPGTGLSHHVHLAGWQRNIPGLLKSADVFALASRFEGMPNAVLEAGAAGIPVVATSVEGVPEILENGRSGWVVEIDDAPALAQAIVEALQGREQAFQRASDLQSVIAEKFTWDTVVEQYDQLYASLLSPDPLT